MEGIVYLIDESARMLLNSVSEYQDASDRDSGLISPGTPDPDAGGQN